MKINNFFSILRIRSFFTSTFYYLFFFFLKNNLPTLATEKIGENLQLNVIEEVEIVNALWETKAYMYNQRSFIEMLARLLERHSMIS